MLSRLDSSAQRPPASCRLPVLLLLAVGMFFEPAPIHAQQRSPARFLHWAYQDALHVPYALSAETGYYTLGGAAALALVAPFDAPLTREAPRLARNPLDTYFYLVNPLGDNKAAWPAAGLFALSLATGDTHFQDAAFTSLQTYVYARLVGDALKSLVGRRRPDAHRGAFSFAPLSGPTAFPSGHTVTAFALVTPWAWYYPHPLTYGLFALSSSAAVARVVEQKHWPTDVLMGAMIGFAVGTWLSRRHQQQPALLNDRVQLRPAWTPHGAALCLRVRWR